MDSYKLCKISKEYFPKILDYKQEFIKNNDSFDGTAGLGNYDDLNDWYNGIILNSSEKTVREGLVPSTTMMLLANDDIVGMIDIRHKLNDNLLKFGGHIGYSIRKSQRNKGYATLMLKLALAKCKEYNIKKVLITCDKDNIASAKVIMNNGGKFENEIELNGEIIQRYWIEIESDM